ncbi:MAG: hypothetical protein ACO1OG_03040 [Devosia sp.]
MRIALVAIAALTGLPAMAQEPAILEPQQIGQIFCLSRVGNDMAPTEALLTPDLAAAISEAEAKNDAIAAAAPDEKPPLGDGIPWQAWPDYADMCIAGEVTLMLDEATVAIEYRFSAYPRANYIDTLKLKLVDGPGGWKVWRIDDIAYDTDGTLRAALSSAFEPLPSTN